MLEKMTWREWIEWQGFYMTDPFGGRRLDYLFALLRSDLHNIVRDKDEAPVTPDELLPGFGKGPKERREEEKEKLAQVPHKVKEALGGI